MKLNKCPNLLKPLATIIQENYQRLYPSEPFRITRFQMRHPVFEKKSNQFWREIWCQVLVILLRLYNKSDFCLDFEFEYVVCTYFNKTINNWLIKIAGILYLLFICGCACTAPSSAVCCAATGFWGMILAMLAQFSVLIWATVRVFGKCIYFFRGLNKFWDQSGVLPKAWTSL